MRKNAKIIQISGLRGLIFIAFVAVCLVAGFVVFPGLVGMCLWNNFLSEYLNLPEINILQGILLWSIVALIIYLSGSGRSVVQMKKAAQLSESELSDLMDRIKKQSQASRINSMILRSEKYDETKKSDLENKSDSTLNENKKENL